METTSIHLDDLEKSWVTLRGKVTALEKIDLTVNKGEFFVLLGPSGCGKSTLLNLIAGLEKPSRGKISFGDRTVACPDERIMLAPFERDIAMVFQSYALYPHMTIEENLTFPLTNRKPKPSKDEMRKLAADAAKLLQIDKLLDRKPAELSGGQRQRVAIGRAIVRNPKIFLMDEPLSNLDAQLRMDMRAQLKALQQKLGVTTIYVTHDQLEAMTLGDRIAILNGGYIQQLGNPMDVFARPVNVFVARFIGSPSMNMFTGELRSENGQDILHSPAITIKLPGVLASKLKARGGAKFTIGVRPEHFTILPAGQGNLDVKIEVIEHIGVESLLYVFLPNGTQIVVKTTDSLQSRDVALGLVPENTHLFDEKENRID
jgi:ABC-type sugar transport system ATPase subunit